MRYLILTLTAVMLLTNNVFTADLVEIIVSDSNYSNEIDSHFVLDFEDGSVILKKMEGSRILFEITDDSQLFINHNHVELTAQQQRLINNYYNLAKKFCLESERLGIEGAKVSVEGALVGLQSVSGTIEIFLSNGFERGIGNRASRIERKADRLSMDALKLQANIDKLQGVHQRLKGEFPELSEYTISVVTPN